MRALWLVLLAACSIPTERFIPFTCDVMTCATGSTCQDTEGVGVCVCDAGLQDNDGDGTCTENCDAVACDTRMACDDANGTAHCVCAAGFQDNDNNGSCTFACSAANCGTNGACDDASGTATCGCAVGYQDNDGDEVCEPSCAITSCAGKGCDDSSGSAQCLCPAGEQDNDNNGTCSPDCSQLTCGTNSTGCSDSTGFAFCNCTGNFVDFDGDGDCTATCGNNLINATASGGTASVVAAVGTNGSTLYQTMLNTCDGHRDPSASICDNAATTNDPKQYTDVYPTSGARFRNFNGSASEGTLVIDAGSAVTFNAVQLYQFFRNNGGTGNTGTAEVRFSRHASTTSAPAYNDAGWIPLTLGFQAVPAGIRASGIITLPLTVSVPSVATRYLRVEVKNTGYSAAIRNAKMFLCQ